MSRGESMKNFNIISVLTFLVITLFSGCNIFIPIDENSDFNWEQDSVRVVLWGGDNVNLKLVGANIPKRVKISAEPKGVVDVIRNEDNSVTLKYIKEGTALLKASYGQKGYECKVHSFNHIPLKGIRVIVNEKEYILNVTSLEGHQSQNFDINEKADSISIKFIECIPNDATFQYISKLDIERRWGDLDSGEGIVNREDRGLFDNVLKGKRIVNRFGIMVETRSIIFTIYFKKYWLPPLKFEAPIDVVASVVIVRRWQP